MEKCNGNCRKLCKLKNCQVCFKKSFASSKKVDLWDHEKNNIKPRDVFLQSNKKYWLCCDKCKHGYQQVLSNAFKCGCPFCANQKLCKKESCKICFNKSFASSKKAILWDYVKNKDVKPRNVFLRSESKYWLRCDKCHHSYQQLLSNTLKCNCPFCCIPSKKLCQDDSCEMCFNKSFKSTSKAKLWSSKNKIEPRMVFRCSYNEYWFECDVCNHIYKQSPHVLIKNGCAFCAGQKICKNEKCIPCFNKSFANSLKIRLWDYEKNDVNPRDVFLHSGEKYWFTCNKCNHSYKKTLSKTFTQDCPKCASSKGEKIIQDYLESNNIIYKKEKSFLDLIHKGKLRFDFYFELNDKKFIIEFDGIQHFIDSDFFSKRMPFVERKRIDLLKTKYCLDNDIIILRISYMEINTIELLVENFLLCQESGFSDNMLYKDHVKLLMSNF